MQQPPGKTDQPHQTRASGVFLHITSLPGSFGIGDLGPSARAWTDRLAGAKQTWWQVLPLNPAGAGNSPYHALSAFAGDQNLISPEDLVEEALLDRADMGNQMFPEDFVDFKRVAEFKDRLLRLAARRFVEVAGHRLKTEFEQFVYEQAHWLADFALFMALRESSGTADWNKWGTDLARREPAALEAARRELATDIRRHQFVQFIFFRQMAALAGYARQRGIKLIGDLPIFVSDHCADVWANPHLFLLDENRRPRFVTGVPPDYFSKTGQRWGNPHYDWPAMRREDFGWWRARIRHLLSYVDRVRIDHFRGFVAAWRIPADAPTATIGRWIKSPGLGLFRRVEAELGWLPFIAEDLGLITPGVERLRDRLGLPGMRVLQFAFSGDPANPFLPDHYVPNCVVYTSTHDTDTTVGWYQTLGKDERAFFHRYTNTSGDDAAWTLIRLAWSSVANTAIAPLQDILGLGSAARLNLPGSPAGNWRWRVRPQELNEEPFERLRETTEMYGRDPPRTG